MPPKLQPSGQGPIKKTKRWSQAKRLPLIGGAYRWVSRPALGAESAAHCAVRPLQQKTKRGSAAVTETWDCNGHKEHWASARKLNPKSVSQKW